MIAAGFLLCALVSLSQADVYPGDYRIKEIQHYIHQNLQQDRIVFRDPADPSIQHVLDVTDLCGQLLLGILSAFIGENIHPYYCVYALRGINFQQYGLAEWNLWQGRHCGVWKTVADHDWRVVLSSTPASERMEAASSVGEYFRQNLRFSDRQGTCCTTGWNGSGGNVRF